jgi:hypothetical protein
LCSAAAECCFQWRDCQCDGAIRALAALVLLLRVIGGGGGGIALCTALPMLQLVPLVPPLRLAGVVLRLLLLMLLLLRAGCTLLSASCSSFFA